MDSPQPRLVRAIEFLLFFGFLAAFLSFVPFQRIYGAIRQANPPYFWIACLAGLPALYLDSIQLRIFVERQGIQIPLARLFEINLVTRFYSFFSPVSSLGSAMRWYKLSADGKSAEALGAVAVNRLFDTFIAVVFGLFWAIAGLRRSAVQPILFVLLLLIILPGWFLLTRYIPPALNWFQGRSLWGGLGFTRRMLPFLGKLSTSLSLYARLSAADFILLAVTGCAGELVSLLGYFLLIHALQIPLSFIDLGWMYSIFFLTSLAPFTLLGGLGLRELSVVMVLSAFGIAPDLAAAYAFLLYARSVVLGLAGGMIRINFDVSRQEDGLMRVCLISVEIFAWGKYGGFGRSTRMIGRELVRRGIEVTAVVPRRAAQRAIETLDGIRVLGFDARRPFSAAGLFRAADADIYHSQEPSMGTWLAQRSMPGRKHVVTFRDTRTLNDWWIEFKYPSRSRPRVLANFVYEDNFLIRRAVQGADRRCAASRMLIAKARRKYGLAADPLFLPSPVPFTTRVQKSERPLVCFVARLDRRKRPELFLELARAFPEVQFEVAGSGQDQRWEQRLRRQFDGLPNLRFNGFQDQFAGSTLLELLARSWVLVNTSARESLPTSFVEAAGQGCAILSGIDPDDFASGFGYHVTDGNFPAGLRFLLQDGTWRERARGAQYVRSVFSVERSMEQHLRLYHELLQA